MGLTTLQSHIVFVNTVNFLFFFRKEYQKGYLPFEFSGLPLQSNYGCYHIHYDM